MSSFYPSPNPVSVLANVPGISIDVFVGGDSEELISNEIAARTENALIRTIFRDSEQLATGGLYYNQLSNEQIQSIGEAAERQPGEEFALVFQPESKALVERVHQFGAKSQITYEAIRRNNVDEMTRLVDFLSLTILRKLDTYVMDILTKAVNAGITAKADSPALSTAIGRDTPIAGTSLGHLINAIAQGADNDLAVDYDTLVLNPVPASQLKIQEKVTGISLAEDFGVNVVPSREFGLDMGFLVDTTRAGEVYWEEPLINEVIDDKSRHIYDIQAWATPAAAITTPHAINMISFNKEA